MNRSERARVFPAGLFAAGLAILAYKALSLSLDVSGSMVLAWRFGLLDLDMLGILLGIGLLVALPRRLLRWPLKVALFLITVYYAVHTVVLLELDEPMSLFDLGRYLPEWGVVQSFLGPGTLLVVLLLVGSLLLDRRLGRGQYLALAAIAPVLFATGWMLTSQAPSDIRKYSLLQLGRVAEAWTQSAPAATYTPGQRAYYATAAAPPAEIPEGRPDIILLIVESLSSINSLRTSGALDLVPQFDSLSRAGTLFPNFFANHAASEGGIIALLSGFPPLHYPTASPLMFDEFATQQAVIHDYVAAGYELEFLTNADLSFIGLDRYLEGLGVHHASGRDEVEAFRMAPRIVQDAPSDRHLYREALRRVDARRQADAPWMLVIATASTHLPYTHPEDGPDTAEAVWNWSLERLGEFHDALASRGFLREGVLLITGDHRQMRPLSRDEIQRYGDSARARVPLLVIGQGVEPGHIDERWFQQADLLRMLPGVWQRERPLSPNPVWVERYNRIYGKVESINRFGVFDRGNGGRETFPVRVFGATLDWTGARPPGYRAIEARVHAQRSAHQFRRNGAGLGCASDLPGRSSAGDELASVAGRLEIIEPGTYWFRAAETAGLCLAVNGAWLIDQAPGAAPMQAPVELAVGTHVIELRYPAAGSGRPVLEWVVPGDLRWRWRTIPPGALELGSGSEMDTGKQ
ncbi:MAG: sulfatase-like hydrolase/transferase [Xanthomonadales bacterium]|nr:sulfatase-like hydrolase/transferase [Xanthomonadales bacterium]